MKGDLKPLNAPRTVSVDGVRPALRDLFRKADARAGTESGQAVVRACGLTVIALAEGEEELTRLLADLGRATAAVPARTLLVQLDSDVEGGLSAEVAAFCTLGPGGRQVCHERIVLRAARDRREDLPPLIASLPVSDLPVLLYPARPELLQSRLVERLLPVADVVLADSEQSDDPAGTLGDLLRLRDRRGVVGLDLAFERLETWREAVACAWDRAAGPGIRLERVEARFHPRDPGGMLLLGWIESRLLGGRRPARFQTAFDAPAEGGVSRDLRLVFRTDQERVRTHLRQVGRHVVEVGGDGEQAADRALPRRIQTDVDVLVRILGDPQDDPIFGEALRAAVDHIPP